MRKSFRFELEILAEVGAEKSCGENGLHSGRSAVDDIAIMSLLRESDESFDPRDDPMAPPREPCECYCLHCQRTFMSDEMWFQRVVGDRNGFEGFWMCPTPNCDGAGFTFDIFPTDPDHPANEGWCSCDDEDDEEEYEQEVAEEPAEYDPQEPKYAQLDELLGDEDDDIEGEEWKYGLEPGEQLPARDDGWSAGRREWEEQQKRYDMPDERPRILDWSNRDEREMINEDDIPF
jgi:hypothetical protein